MIFCLNKFTTCFQSDATLHCLLMGVSKSVGLAHILGHQPYFKGPYWCLMKMTRLRRWQGMLTKQGISPSLQNTPSLAPILSYLALAIWTTFSAFVKWGRRAALGSLGFSFHFFSLTHKKIKVINRSKVKARITTLIDKKISCKNN